MGLDTKVVRNEVDWTYGDKDGGPGSIGTVFKKENTVLYVKWDIEGNDDNYNWGQYGKTDVKVYCPLQLQGMFFLFFFKLKY